MAVSSRRSFLSFSSSSSDRGVDERERETFFSFLFARWWIFFFFYDTTAAAQWRVGWPLERPEAAVPAANIWRSRLVRRPGTVAFQESIDHARARANRHTHEVHLLLLLLLLLLHGMTTKQFRRIIEPKFEKKIHKKNRRKLSNSSIRPVTGRTYSVRETR